MTFTEWRIYDARGPLTHREPALSGQRENQMISVDSLIKGAHRNREDMQTAISFCLSLFKRDMLPTPGRLFIAEVLTKLSRGIDPLPPNKKKKGVSDLRVAIEVAREATKAGATRNRISEAVYRRVANRLSHANRTEEPLSLKTVKARASRGRQQIRDHYSTWPHGDFVETFAKLKKLPPEAVRNFLL
jgi:hypothetical protein